MANRLHEAYTSLQDEHEQLVDRADPPLDSLLSAVVRLRGAVTELKQSHPESAINDIKRGVHFAVQALIALEGE